MRLSSEKSMVYNTEDRLRIEESWKQALLPEFASGYMSQLRKFLQKSLREGKRIYPPMAQIFAAFDFCPLPKTKVVIIGQDPYINPEQAHGLCFSVPKGVKPPPSLDNIFKEINEDIGPSSAGALRGGCLVGWAEQGVLLLNSVLTVFARQSASHHGMGWEQFTDRVVAILSEQRENLVFLLWGAYAQRKGANIDQTKHLVLTAAHPSPLSAHNGFFGCRHFSRTNEYLIETGQRPIDWYEVS